ncbi:MAG: HEPN-associated N-terminal domain-containing protein [Acidimicrobiaceae bacterium]|nr:HEPN-associated N-terminal domain-containing protein [Acidimicrobiaceae bacterium]
MGYWKNRLLEEQQQGWTSSDKLVCVECIEEPALADIVQSRVDSNSACDFCGGSPAAPLDVLVDAFVNGLRNEFELAIDSVPWEGREGGFLINLQWDTYDLVWDHVYAFNSEELTSAVCESIHDDTWVEKDWITRRRDEILMDTWSTFCEAVKHQTRYVIWLLPDIEDIGAGEIQLSRILDHIARLLSELDLFKEITAERHFWRAHCHDEAPIQLTAARLGTAPPDLARQDNRMSPAGIPLFYGALSEETAVKEVDVGDNCPYLTLAAFETVSDMKVVDFTSLPEIPSMFDSDLGHTRREIGFLHEFVAELSKPINSADTQIEYVPTQVVTEFLLHVFRAGEDSPALGLIYQSSVADGECIVLNIPNHRCLDTPDLDGSSEPGLLLVEGSVSTRAK